MRVQEVMTEGVITIAPTLPAEDGYNLMRTRGVHHLVVADEGGVAGVLSDRDTGGRQGSSVRRNRTVAELMTPRVVTVSPTTTVRKAANLMRGRSIGCLVVTKRDRIVGIVTVADLLELVGRGADRPVASTTRWTLKHRAPHRKRHRAAGVW
jgi:CBS domain-containing protein